MKDLQITFKTVIAKGDAENPITFGQKIYSIFDNGLHYNGRNKNGWLDLSPSEILTDAEKKTFETLVKKLLPNLENILILDPDHRYKSEEIESKV